MRYVITIYNPLTHPTCPIQTSFNPKLTDPALVVIKAVFAVLLIRLARNIPVSLQLTRLDWLRNTEHALWLAALLILVSAIIDIAIAIDLALNEGRFAASIVGTVNLLSVLIIGWVAVQAGKGTVDPDTEHASTANKESAPGAIATHGGQELLDTLNKLLIDQKLFSDTNLNLQKLARKAGHPPRAISRTRSALYLSHGHREPVKSPSFLWHRNPSPRPSLWVFPDNPASCPHRLQASLY